MKLILASNQTPQFVDFYKSLGQQSQETLEYAGYNSLLFIYDSDTSPNINVINIMSNRQLSQYDGIYINSYLKSYELAAATAICCEALRIPYKNKELHNPPSMSKLTAHAKLAAHNVRTPKTLAGTKAALLAADSKYTQNLFPAILKRADADRGIDNFKLQNMQEVKDELQKHDDSSLWILQEFIKNNGFYLVTFYDQQPAFCIYRELLERPDGNTRKAHMYKPKGGHNATLLALGKVPKSIINECSKAIIAMNRQIASVDCLYDEKSDKTYALEVNYNPQLVTIETFKEVRTRAFIKEINKDWN